MTSIDLCAASHRDGWCAKCLTKCQQEDDGTPICVELEEQVGFYDDNGDFDHDAYDKYGEINE